MKTNNRSKKLLTAFIAFILLTFSTSARPIVTFRHYPHPLSVQYLGIKNDFLIFKVTVRAGDLKKPELFIDESGKGSLYWKKLSGKTKVEWVRVKNSDNLNIRFEVVVPNKSYYETFTASTNIAKTGTIVSERADVAVNE